MHLVYGFFFFDVRVQRLVNWKWLGFSKSIIADHQVHIKQNILLLPVFLMRFLLNFCANQHISRLGNNMLIKTSKENPWYLLRLRSPKQQQINQRITLRLALRVIYRRLGFWVLVFTKSPLRRRQYASVRGFGRHGFTWGWYTTDSATNTITISFTEPIVGKRFQIKSKSSDEVRC